MCQNCSLHARHTGRAGDGRQVREAVVNRESALNQMPATTECLQIPTQRRHKAPDETGPSIPAHWQSQGSAPHRQSRPICRLLAWAHGNSMSHTTAAASYSCEGTRLAKATADCRGQHNRIRSVSAVRGDTRQKRLGKSLTPEVMKALPFVGL